MFFPLVVLVAVLPGLYALGRWDLNPPGPWWGLRGLAVLDGQVVDQVPAASLAGPEAEARQFRTVALQPPLYAWLEAVCLLMAPGRAPLATVLPSYVAGALVVVLVYLHGRHWGGPALGLLAAALTGFNRELLIPMQQATPTTAAMVGALIALLAYGRHLRPGPGRGHTWEWGRGVGWATLGGLGLGLSLMAVGGFGLIAVAVVLLHQAYLRTGWAPCERPSRWWRAGRSHPSLPAGALALAVGLLLAAPWHIRMARTYGDVFLDALLAPPVTASILDPGVLRRLATLAPLVLPMGLLATGRVLAAALRGRDDDCRSDDDDRAHLGGVFWAAWLAVAALIPAFWPSGPRPAFDLFLLIPLDLLAARAIVDLASRRIPVRNLIWLAPATALAFAWWASADLRAAIAPLALGRPPDAATALGLHLGIDLLVILGLASRRLVRWARRRDDRRRLALGGFLVAVLATVAATGVREVRFRHRETRDLLILREVVLRLHRDRPFTLVAVVGPANEDGPSPGGRLRFILRTALPETPLVDLTRAEDLMGLPDGQRLVILVGEHRLSYALQSQLGLWAIHPGRSGVLDAFATAQDLDPTVWR